MPSFTNHHSSEFIKLLLMAESGTGKTGALAALANAGYQLFILDYDNGLDILKTYLRPECIGNINYITLQDELEIRAYKSDKSKGKHQGDTLSFNTLKRPTAYPRGLKMLNFWKEKENDINFGRTAELGSNAFVVIDSLTMMGKAALLYTTAVNDNVQAWQSDWGEAMNRQEMMVQELCSANFHTNVIITSHIYQDADTKGNPVGPKLPSFLGRKLPPVGPRFFNTVLSMRVGGGGKREIITESTPELPLKSSAPNALNKRYPLEVEKDGDREYAINGLAAVVETIHSAMQVETTGATS